MPLAATLDAQDQQVDSLKKLLLTQADDTSKVNTLYELSEICDEADVYTYAKQSLELAEKLEFKKGIANASLNLGFALNLQGDINGSIACFQRSLVLYTELGSLHGISVAHNNLGLTYGNQGNMKDALDHYLAALSIQEKTKDDEGAATTFNNIGLIYAGQNDNDKALECYFKGLKKLVDLDHKKEMAYCYVNISNIYNRKKMYSKSMDMLLNGLAIQEQIKDAKGIAYTLNQMGQLEQLLGNTPQARDNFERSLSMAKQAGDKAGIGYALRNLASIARAENDLGRAEELCLQALVMSKELGYPEAIASNSQLLSLIYGDEKKYEASYAMYKQYIQMKDSLNNLEVKRSTLKRQLQYDFDRKEAEAKAAQDKKDAVTRIVIWSISGGLLLVVILAGFIFRSYRQKQKANIIILEQKMEVERQKHIVELKQKEILDSIHYARRIQRSLLPTERYIERIILTLKRKV